MMEEQFDCNVAKEFLTYMSYFNDSIIERLPDSFLRQITLIAADSKKNYFVEKDKKLYEQNISDECLDLIAAVYLLFAANEEENKRVLDILLNNEKDSNK